jgi:carbamoyltransferase
MLVLGLSNLRDAAAAIVKGGQVVAAAEEERFVRIKHVNGLPVHAIRYCLHEAGVELKDLDAIAVPWKYWVVGRRGLLAAASMLRSADFFRVKSRRVVERLMHEWAELAWLPHHLRRRVGRGAVRPVYLDHHLCHAASAYLTSPFDRAALLVVDGASEAHTTLLGSAEGRNISVIDRIPLPHSLGQFYAAVTSYLGFRPDHDEYIVMGLAGYGSPSFAGIMREHLLRLEPNGRFRLNTGILDYHLARVGLFSRDMVRLFGGPRRAHEDLTTRHRDIAASAQLVLEEALLHVARHLHEVTKADRLCIAGGVGFNCVANSRLLHELPFREVYVQPASGDAGTSLGAALWWACRRGGPQERPTMPSVYLGPQFGLDECRAVLARAGLASEELPDELLYERVAADLAQGKLVFWFQGRMEWGPRALGNRSLLADPRREDMRALINARVKLREPYRPFAPSVLAEEAVEYFDLAAPSPYMSFTAQVRATAKGVIPAVTHVDGTARVQTVSRESNPKFHALLTAFHRQTGVPVLLNTSFNVNEPIVCSPEDAVACFRRTQVDRLVLGNLLVRRATAVTREP